MTLAQTDIPAGLPPASLPLGTFIEQVSRRWVQEYGLVVTDALAEGWATVHATLSTTDGWHVVPLAAGTGKSTSIETFLALDQSPRRYLLVVQLQDTTEAVAKRINILAGTMSRAAAYHSGLRDRDALKANVLCITHECWRRAVVSEGNWQRLFGVDPRFLVIDETLSFVDGAEIPTEQLDKFIGWIGAITFPLSRWSEQVSFIGLTPDGINRELDLLNALRADLSDLNKNIPGAGAKLYEPKAYRSTLSPDFDSLKTFPNLNVLAEAFPWDKLVLGMESEEQRSMIAAMIVHMLDGATAAADEVALWCHSGANGRQLTTHRSIVPKRCTQGVITSATAPLTKAHNLIKPTPVVVKVPTTGRDYGNLRIHPIYNAKVGSGDMRTPEGIKALSALVRDLTDPRCGPLKDAKRVFWLLHKKVAHGYRDLVTAGRVAPVDDPRLVMGTWGRDHVGLNDKADCDAMIVTGLFYYPWWAYQRAALVANPDLRETIGSKEFNDATAIQRSNELLHHLVQGICRTRVRRPLAGGEHLPVDAFILFPDADPSQSPDKTTDTSVLLDGLKHELPGCRILPEWAGQSDIRRARNGRPPEKLLKTFAILSTHPPKAGDVVWLDDLANQLDVARPRDLRQPLQPWIDGACFVPDWADELVVSWIMEGHRRGLKFISLN